MDQPVAWAMAAMVCYGVADFIYKQAAAGGIRADHFLMAQAWVFCPLVTLYALATGNFVAVPAALWGSVAGLFVFIGFYFFSRSLATGAVSTNASIFRLNFVVTAALAIAVLGEPITPIKLVGLVFALIATRLLVGGERAPDAASGEAQRRSLAQVAVATLAFGASNFFHTVGLRHGAVPETLAVAQAALFMPLATAVVWIKDRGLRAPAAAFKFGAAAAFTLLGATLFMLRSVARGQASVLVPIAQMGFIVAALLGIFVLRERVTPRKAIGLTAALAALAVLAAN
jgi:uncharacterized membrane protein